VRSCPSCGRQNADDQDFCVCGEYLRWEATSLLPAASAAPPAAPQSDPPDVPDAAPPAAPSPGDAPPGASPPPAADAVSLTLRLPGDQLADSLQTVKLAVAPGGRAVLLAHVRNQSDIVDNYDIGVVGLPEGWWSVVPPTVYLVPFGAGGTYEQEVEIHVHPPRAPEAQARTWSFDVTVWSRAQRAQGAAAPASVDIAPYQDLRTDLTPDRARGRRQARFTFAAENRANAPTQVELSALDSDGECAFHYAQSSVTIEPAERVEVPLVVRPPRQIWIGRARDRQFEATARPREGELPMAPQQGVYRQRSWLPWWLLVALPMLAALAAATLLLLPKKTTVPNLTSASSRFAAEQALTKARLNPVPQVETVTGPGKPGAILAQAPTAGSKVKPGTTVTIKVVVGSTQVIVPSVVGLKVQAAAAVLDKVGLKLGEMLPPPPDPQATIGSQIPAAGKRARPGDAITLFVVHGAPAAPGTGGAGAAAIALPKVAGQTPAAAAAGLAKAGLLPTEVQRYDAAPAGTLVRSVPDAGAQLAKGASVQLIVSAGFPLLIFDTADGLTQVNGTGGAPAPLPGTNRGDDEATWSADASHIAYRSGDDIMLAVPGQPGSVLAHREGQSFHDPTFAPAGRVLALVSRSAAGDGDLCLLDVKAGAKPACIKDPGTDVGRSVSWSPDGRQILVAGHAKDRPDTFGLVLYRSSKPFSARASDWGKGEVVTDASKPNVGALAGAFSPDGKSLAVAANIRGGFQLFITTADDFKLSQAKQFPVAACAVAWRPDGAELAVVQTPSCNSDATGPIARFDPANPMNVVPLVPSGAHPAWQPLRLGG
jgi:beta-lactam-binding protein with PASTA domain